MRYSATEKLEIIELVGQSNLPQRRCLASLGVPRQTCLSVWDRIFSTHIPEPAAGQLGMVIGIDGGIKESNVAQIAASGVDFIFVGSAILLQKDPAASFRRLTQLAQRASGK